MTTHTQYEIDTETERLKAVRRYDILDTPPDGSFDRITQVASRLFDVPISIISIVDHDRIWFKSHHGVDAEEIGRDPGLCASAILKNEPHVLNDTRLDPHSLTNPLVAGNMGFRFYAGVPLHTHDGYNLGTLCIIDTKVRELTADDIKTLEDLASVVMDQLELRLSARNALAAKEHLLKEINHRVGNSLQLVSNALMIQAIESDPVNEIHFKNAADRIARIGRVHHRLSQVGPLEKVDFREYLTALCEDLSYSILGGTNIQIVVDAEDAELSPQTATLLGLVVNELVTNSAKYAYSNAESGLISVSFRSDAQQWRLTVSDDGRGISGSEGTKADTSGVGTRLIRSLVEEIEGALIQESGNGGKGLRTMITFSKELN